MSDQLDQTIDEKQPANQPPATPLQTPDVTTEPTAPSQDDGGRDYEAEIKKLRAEAAKYRTERNDYRNQVKELSPAAKKLAEIEEANKSEEQKLRERIAAMEAETQAAKQAAELAAKEATLVKIAAKAGLDPSIAALLDINKLDLDDEDSALETLKLLAPAPAKPSGGTASNPRPQNGKLSDEELKFQYFGKGRASKIFGGN